jgi:PDDEXK-like domain of unknown function (DUF3799)
VKIDHPLGLVEMTNDAYHAGPGISKSHLDCIRSGSPKHYWHRYLNPEREPDVKTPDMIKGSAIHAAILQPDLAEKLVVIGLPHARRSKAEKEAWAEFELANMGKFILKPEDYDEVMHVRDTIWSHPVAPGLLSRGKAEQSFFAVRDVPDGEGGVLIDHETGEVIRELVKCQTDFIRDDWDYIVDLKSTTDASPIGFAKSCANYRYPVQAAWYQDVLDAAYGRHPETWVVMALEKEAPWALGIYYFEEVDVARGRIAADRDFKLIADCRRQNRWPDFGAQIQPLALPAWSRL